MPDPHPDPATDLRACAFDAYGTLLDFDGTVARVADRIGTAKATELARLWRARQREGAVAVNDTTVAADAGAAHHRQGHADFWHITGAALDAAMTQLGVNDPVLRARLMQFVLNLDPFADAVPALEALRARGIKTAILSNGTTTMLLSAAKHAGLDRAADALISTEPTGRFKPASAAYAPLPERLRLPATAIGYVSANGWDADAALANGFRALWLDRGGSAPSRAPRIATLRELPAALGLVP